MDSALAGAPGPHCYTAAGRTRPMMNAMTVTPPKLNPARCPLCGHANQCAMELARATGTTPAPCWCTEVKFAPELLDRIPDEAQRRACVCQACATSV